MKKFKTIRTKLTALVIFLTISLILTYTIYEKIEKRELYINSQISSSLKSQRLIVDIEKIVYQEAVTGEDKDELISEDIGTLIALYQNNYLNHMVALSDYKLVQEYGMALNQLKDSYESGSLMTYDYDLLRSINGDIQQDLIEAIRTHNDKGKFDFAIILSLLIIVVIWTIFHIYHDIITPLKKVTEAFNDQQLRLTEIRNVKVENEIGILVHEYNDLINRNRLLIDLNEKINDQKRFDEVFDYIYKELKSYIPYDRIGLAVVNHNGEMLEALLARSEREICLKGGYKQRLEKSSLKDVIEKHDIRIINDLEAYYKEHPFSDSTKRILDEGMRSSITLPIFHENRAIGVVFFSSVNKEVYTPQHQAFLVNIAKALGTSLEKGFIFDNLMISTVRGFAKIVESKDNVTGNHIDRISHYSGFVASILQEQMPEISDRFIRAIKRLSPLHDIGKVAIPDHILNKPGRLDQSEFEIMKGHSNRGAEILEELLLSVGASDFRMAVDIARYHHEKVDGSGYPLGLKSTEIPLAARIVALVDVFDALTSKRPYKKAMTFDEAIYIIQKDSGKHFDASIVSVLMNNLSEFKALYESLWM